MEPWTLTRTLSIDQFEYDMVVARLNNPPPPAWIIRVSFQFSNHSFRVGNSSLFLFLFLFPAGANL